MAKVAKLEAVLQSTGQIFDAVARERAALFEAGDADRTAELEGTR